MNPPPANIPPLTGESTAVQAYLNILQNIITRMATNSGNCKSWCITLVAAILVVIADKKVPNYAWIAIIPVILFFLLDAYYLGQERAFREIYNHFVNKLHTGKAVATDLFVLRPMQGANVVQALFSASSSFAVYPFYGVLAGMVFIARFFIL